MEIVYCVDCGKKLREHDFVRGAAYTRNKQHFCTTCRPLEPQAPPPPPVRPKSTRIVAPRPRGPGLGILGAAAAALLLVVAAAIAFSTREPAVTPEAVEAAERTRRESAARDAVQQAKAFAIANPKDLDGQIQVWQKSVPVSDRTSFAQEARLALSKAVAAKEAAVDRAEAAKRALGPPPMASWDFEQMTAEAFVNRGGELYNALRMPGVDQAEGVVGKAARFDGRSHLKIDRSELFNSPDLTVSLWMKPVNTKGRQGLLSKRTDSKQSPLVLCLWDGALKFEAADEATHWPFQIKSLPVVKAGEWSHVAVVAKAGVGIELYLNGALLQDFKLDKRRCTNADPLFLGRDTYNGAGAHDGSATFTGLIDELKVWARPLTAAEIKANFDAGVPKPKD